MSSNLKKTILHVHGMTCPHCEMTIENSLQKLDTVKEVKAYHQKSLVEINHEPDLNIPEIKSIIEGLGYKVMEK